MTPTIPHEECTIAAPGAESLPVVAWLKYPSKKPELARADRYSRLTDEERGRGWVSQDLVRLSDAQATIDRLKAERDEALVQRDVNLAGARRLEAELALARSSALDEAAVICETAPDFLQDSTFDGAARAIRALKAQATPTSRKVDVEAVMRMAEDYAQAVSEVNLTMGEVWRSEDYRLKRIAERDAAREALRAYLAEKG